MAQLFGIVDKFNYYYFYFFNKKNELKMKIKGCKKNQAIVKALNKSDL